MKRRAAGILALLWCIKTQASQPITLLGGNSEAAAVDITSHIVANEDVAFSGGYFVVNLPQSGNGVIEASTADSRLSYSGSTHAGAVGYAAPSDPTLVYSGTISGNGALTVQSGFSAVQPSPGNMFTGGVLMFANQNGQTWGWGTGPSGAHNPAALTIGPNAMVSFYFPGSYDIPVTTAGKNGTPIADAFPWSATTSRNIVNNGYLYSSTANHWGSVTGTGLIAMTLWGGDAGVMISGTYLSASHVILENGAQIMNGVVFEDQPNGQPTTLVVADIAVFRNGLNQWLTIPSSFNVGDPSVLVTPNVVMWGLDLQLWYTGINQFTGIMVPPHGSNSYWKPLPIQEAVKMSYFFGHGFNNGFGRVIDIQGGTTLLMGDGRQIITNPDGVTNNVFYQGNPFNTLLSVNNFGPSVSAGAKAEGVAYNYSGTYKVNHNMNATTDGMEVIGPRNGDWLNLIIVDPTKWNSKATLPNHPIITVPVFFAGITQIEKHAILQIGDGTVGTDQESKTLSVNGASVTANYNDSMGNGMLMTQGNAALINMANAAITFSIINNGELIVNNTPGALSMTVSTSATVGVSAAVAAWVNANEFDGISGSGSVTQSGTLPMTLGSSTGNPNSYTGGTVVDKNATLIVGSGTAFGAHDSAESQPTGNVLNLGFVVAVDGVQSINVPGDYSQAATGMVSGAMSSSSTVTKETRGLQRSSSQLALLGIPFVFMAYPMRRRSRIAVSIMILTVVMTLNGCKSSDQSTGVSSGQGTTEASSSSSGTSTSPATSTPPSTGVNNDPQVTPISDGPIVTPTQVSGGGSLVLRVAGTSQGTNYQYLNVGGKAIVAGELVVNFISPFTPQSGQSFVLISAAAGLSGTFSRIVTNGIAVTPSYGATTFSITVN